MNLVLTSPLLSTGLVALGGALGSVARFTLYQALQTGFWGTLVINLLGCLLVGVVVGLGETCFQLSPSLRLFLLAGVAGGFTTFSAFGLEIFQLLRQGEGWTAALYAGASLVLGLLAVALGWWCTWCTTQAMR